MKEREKGTLEMMTRKGETKVRDEKTRKSEEGKVAKEKDGKLIGVNKGKNTK